MRIRVWALTWWCDPSRNNSLLLSSSLMVPLMSDRSISSSRLVSCLSARSALLLWFSELHKKGEKKATRVLFYSSNSLCSLSFLFFRMVSVVRQYPWLPKPQQAAAAWLFLLLVFHLTATSVHLPPGLTPLVAVNESSLKYTIRCGCCWKPLELPLPEEWLSPTIQKKLRLSILFTFITTMLPS